MWMTEPDADPADGCLWPIISHCNANSTLADEVVDYTKQAAVDLLHEASGRQFGVCSTTVRPCAPSCDGFHDLNMWDLLDAQGHVGMAAAAGPWTWMRVHCGRCRTEVCSCTKIESILLPYRRIRGVTQVQIDGAIVDPSAYRVDGRLLIRTDGGTWPTCQDLNVANGEVGSWSVTVVYGTPVPTAGQIATGTLACELAKAICDDESCELPQRVQTVTRQGVTIGFVDPMTFLRENRTGLYLVDLWLNSVNPNRLRRRARVFRSDAPRAGRRANPISGS
jgi:hypothetical protein